jgi:hypothetical protein
MALNTATVGLPALEREVYDSLKKDRDGGGDGLGCVQLYERCEHAASLAEMAKLLHLITADGKVFRIGQGRGTRYKITPKGPWSNGTPLDVNEKQATGFDVGTLATTVPDDRPEAKDPKLEPLASRPPPPPPPKPKPAKPLPRSLQPILNAEPHRRLQPVCRDLGRLPDRVVRGGR